MYCTNCGNTIPEESLVCGFCGHPVEQAVLEPSAGEETTPEQNDPAPEIPQMLGTEQEEFLDAEETQEELAQPEAEVVPPPDEEGPPIPPAPAAQPLREIPSYRVPLLDKRTRPITTVGFFGTQLLLLIPLVNLLLLFIWAFRRKTNLNRRAFARSILIWLVILLVALLAVVVVLLVMKVPVDLNYWLQQLKDAVNRIPAF
jgi:hypothetical protein